MHSGRWLPARSPAGACTTVSLDRGLTIKNWPLDLRTIAGDGVLAFDAIVYDEPLEVALVRFSLSSFCEPTRLRVVPGLDIRASLADADRERAYLWVAPWDGQAPGFPFERTNPWFSQPELYPWWSAWDHRYEIRLPEVSGRYCAVVGATSFIDGSTALSEPICRELTAAREEERTPMFPSPEDDFQRECLTPPVYEHDGSPYPRPPESGCRLAAAGPGALAWILLVARRRRRSPPA